MKRDDRRHASHGSLRSRLVTRVAVALLALLAVAAPVAATDICGPIGSDTTWSAAGSPYVVTCGVLVMSGATLTIEPNVVVQFNANLALQVDGQLIARGTKGAPITFTKHGDANWGYIWLTDTSVDAQFDPDGHYVSGSIIEHAIIEYAGAADVTPNGALRVYKAYPFIYANIIRNNLASGIAAWDLEGVLRVTNNVVAGNTFSTGCGGGLYLAGGTTVVTNTTVAENASRRGGGICLNRGTLTLTDSRIAANSTTLFGGGLVLELSTATVERTAILGNTTTGSGGGIYVSNGATVSLTNSVVSANTAGGDGGGIYQTMNCFYVTLSLVGNRITRNAATNGGGAYLSGGCWSGQNWEIVTLTGNIIADNVASTLAGGIYLLSDGNSPVTGNSFVRNRAPNASAVWYSVIDGKAFTTNLLFGNVATGPTGATVMLAAGHPLFNVNNLYGNTGAYQFWNDNPQSPTTVNAENNWWGTDSDAQIMAQVYDFFDDGAKSIVDFSPFLNASNPAAPAPPIDKVGAFRPVGGTFYLDANGTGTWEGCGTDRCLSIGMSGDIPIVGDWNGTWSSKVGVFRPSDGTFYLDKNGSGTWEGCATDSCLQIGQNGDTPLVGDWNGSGTSKVGAFRPADGTFYLDYNGNGVWEGCGTDRCLRIGMSGDTPLVGKW